MFLLDPTKPGASGFESFYMWAASTCCDRAGATRQCGILETPCFNRIFVHCMHGRIHALRLGCFDAFHFLACAKNTSWRRVVSGRCISCGPVGRDACSNASRWRGLVAAGVFAVCFCALADLQVAFAVGARTGTRLRRLPAITWRD